MRHFTTLVVAITVVASACSDSDTIADAETVSTTAAAASEAGVSTAFLADRLSDVVIPEDTGSAMVVVVEPGGQTTQASQGTDPDGNAPEPGDAFRVGSITKVFTSALVLGLVDDGLIALDDPVSAHVTRLSVPDGVTIRHLLQHRSGIANYTTAEFFDLQLADVGRDWMPEESYQVVADAPPEFTPGSAVRYSNTDYLLLGVLIEEVTSEPYHVVLRSRILDPLDMSSTYLAGREEGPAPVVGYSTAFTGSLDPITTDYTSIATGAWSAGALVSTAPDLHQFFRALFDGGLVSDEMLDEMTTVVDGFGLGLEVDPTGTGEALFGHFGGIFGYQAMALHARDSGRTGFWVATSDSVGLRPAISGIAPALASGSAALEAAPDAPIWEQGRNALVPAGIVRLPEFGGVQFELAEDRRILQDRAYTILQFEDGDEWAEVDLVAPTATFGGEPITTIEELEAALVDEVGADLVPTGELDTNIGTASAFDFTVDYSRVNYDEALLAVGNDLYAPLEDGRFWLIDTIRGPLMVTVEIPRPASPLLDEATDVAELVLATIEFIDL